MKHKLIFGLSLVLIICIIFGVNNKKQNPEAATSNQKYYACITIDEDETLWTIAEEHYSEECANLYLGHTGAAFEDRTIPMQASLLTT